ncbi:MAG: GDP-mannose 4,6-dehydratase [Acidobacteriota bacterium]
MTVVITGGAGFVGRHLAVHLRQAWPAARLVIWDRSPGSREQNTETVPVDITQPKSYQDSLQKNQPDWMVHLAAMASVSVVLQQPREARRVNVMGTQHLLESIEKYSSHTRMLAVSSADIYGATSGQHATPLPELPLDEIRPTNPYAKSKWNMEKIIQERYQKRCLIVRPFPHIGPGQQLGFVTADFASQIAAIEAGHKDPHLYVGNLEAVRDFTDVRDVARAYRLLMEKGEIGEVYNVASGKGLKIRDLLNHLLALSTAQITVEQDPERMRPSDTPVLIGDATKLRHVTAWQPNIALEQSLHDVLTVWRHSGRAV